MDEKSPYPFNPFIDSLLGEKFLVVWSLLQGTENELLMALRKNLGQNDFYFTPNASKQLLMVRYPEQIRKLISVADFEEIDKLLVSIANGKADTSQKPALDIAFELMEWLLIGFDFDEQLGKLLSSFFGHPNIINASFVEQMRDEYIKDTRG